MKYTYDIRQFKYNKETNTLYAEAFNLEAQLPDGSTHQDPFPSGRGQFYVKNHETGNERRFTSLKEQTVKYYDNHEEEGWTQEFTQWVFESEDGIKCVVNLD
jgi:hypothetical protein